MNLHEIDKRLSGIIKDINFYSLLTPTNQYEEKQKFFKKHRNGQGYNPVFLYRKHDLTVYLKSLETLKAKLDTQDQLERLFKEKMDFAIGQIRLLQSEDHAFTEISAELYGIPDKVCLEEAGNILEKISTTGYVFPDETVTPCEMAVIFQKNLGIAGIDWEVILSDKIIPKITVSGKDKRVYINSRINYTREEVQRLKVHEIDVHVYRGANGDIQPFWIFREGLAGYDETEEGLAIILEEMSGCLRIDNRQEKIYAARALSVEYSIEGAFYDVFIRLKDFFPEEIAYRMAERTKRGLTDTSLSGGFTKDFHYMSGWRKLRKYAEEKKDIKILYTGKIGVEHVEIVEALISSKVLSPPCFVPEILLDETEKDKKVL
ncbi:MAG: tyrosine/phenylalanine carboxypeptidase domain-containing protein [Candidatus Omnitrophota bacterium]